MSLIASILLSLAVAAIVFNYLFNSILWAVLFTRNPKIGDIYVLPGGLTQTEYHILAIEGKIAKMSMHHTMLDGMLIKVPINKEVITLKQVYKLKKEK